MDHENKILRLTINNKDYEWKAQYITGAEIIKLAGISEGHELFLKIASPWEDETILPETSVDLARPGLEHFFSKPKAIVLIVNGREKHWEEATITFDQLIFLAFGSVSDNPNRVFSAQYKNGPEQNPAGPMSKGDTVYTKNKMIFNVTATDKS